MGLLSRGDAWTSGARNTILEQEGSDPVPERGHVGALLEPSGWPIYPDSMRRFQEQSTRVG